jgi:DNA-binding NtrC family response regulator
MSKARRSAEQEGRVVIRDAEMPPLEFRETAAPLLGRCVVLLAMKRGRAPLPVSPALWKRLQHRGFPSNLDELGNLARRYLFLGDARMLLTELRFRPQNSHADSGVVKHPESRLQKRLGIEG